MHRPGPHRSEEDSEDPTAEQRLRNQTPEPVAGSPLASPLHCSATSFAVGEVLAEKYRLERELATGGMGTVWIARNLALDADVAIKVLHANNTEPNPTDRLLREARAVARLGHPSIVRVFDVGYASNGMPFLVMELLRGADLRKTVTSQGRLDAITAVKVLLPIAHALATAHDAGIIHRDLKPENIFLTRQAGTGVRPILLDFGIAKVWTEPSHRLTQQGAILGSPEFMSPEQACGDEVTHRSDI